MKRKMKRHLKSWIGFDLDGTLAEYHEWEGLTSIGKPIPSMVEKVKSYLDRGIRCKIVTARVNPYNEDFIGDYTNNKLYSVYEAIRTWCLNNIDQELKIVYGKDMHMLYLYDDRAVQVEPNTGRIIGKELEL